MGAEAEIVCPQSVPNLDAVISCSQLDMKSPDASDNSLTSTVLACVPNIRSGSFADIGPRTFMEDEHVRIDDLSLHLLSRSPRPSAFYGVFDGHGGPEAAAYVRKNVMRLFFEDVDFPEASELDEIFLESIESCLRKAFLLADLALADNNNIGGFSGTTALTALILGKLLLVANAGDCRAVLSRRGEAIDMSQDHRPTYQSEKKRVEELGGYISDGYLNGELSVTRALGDWELKRHYALESLLISEPELRQIILTEDDEFLIIGCDGIWDVMSSQHAVSIVRRGLRRHNDPEQSAKDLVREALRLNTSDNLTVIVVCFSAVYHWEQKGLRQRFILSADATSSLRSLLEGNDSH